MATYGRYEVITYPSGYVITDMNTHQPVSKMITNRVIAHRRARRLQRRDARAAQSTASTENHHGPENHT